MKRLKPIKLFIVFYSIFLLSLNSFSQECIVEKESLKGTYTGDCKKGKANGKGKSVGTDTYNGEFKAGLPDGEGTYTWSNGNTYTGHFLKGLRNGEGALKYKKINAADSVVEGMWKDDVYFGKLVNPYTVYFKSRMVTELEVEYNKEGSNEITFFIVNTSGGVSRISGDISPSMEGSDKNTESPKLKVDEIHLSSGTYGRLVVHDEFSKKTESVMSEVQFPIHMKVLIGSEEIDINFREKGSYKVNVHINQ